MCVQTCSSPSRILSRNNKSSWDRSCLVGLPADLSLLPIRSSGLLFSAAGRGAQKNVCCCLLDNPDSKHLACFIKRHLPPMRNQRIDNDCTWPLNVGTNRHMSILLKRWSEVTHIVTALPGFMDVIKQQADVDYISLC